MTAWRWPWQRLASPPLDIWRLLRQISVAPAFRYPSVQPNPQAAAAAKPPPSSGPVYPFSPRISRLLEFSGASSGSQLAGWCQRSASWVVARLAPLTGSAARSNRPESGRTTHRRRPAAKKRHLFVVLEDYDDDSFAIHKLDIGGGNDEGDLDIHSGSLRRLPEAPVGRIGCRDGHRRMLLLRKQTQFAALGSRIVAIGPSTDLNLTSVGSLCGAIVVVYETKTTALTTSDLPLRYFFRTHELAVAARDRLYVLESNDAIDAFYRTNDVLIYGGLHCLKSDDDKADRRQGKGGRRSCRWMWQPLPNADSPRFFWGSKNDYTTRVPFDWARITAHAVHPRGGTIFLSAANKFAAGEYHHVPPGTFSYGVRSGRWTRRGDWLLPFKGPAHYDPDLDAWVGLDASCDPGDDVPCRKDDEIHLCACSVLSGGRASRHGQPPPWKKVRVDELLQEDPDCSHVKMQLLYVGGRSEYCLLEHLRMRVKAMAGDGEDEFVLRLTMFQVVCGDDGGLVIVARQPARSYQLPSHDARAFCM